MQTSRPISRLSTSLRWPTFSLHFRKGLASAAPEPPPLRRKLKPLTPSQRDFLSSAVRTADHLSLPVVANSRSAITLSLVRHDYQLRVNHAGELAATLIYEAQSPVLATRHPPLRPLMASMLAQESGHLRTFEALLRRHRVRPTALQPAWRVLATGLGWATAVMGREAAMACTEAVETEIGSHYNDQIRILLDMFARWRADGYDVSDELSTLLQTLRRIRDEELEHLDHAIENDAQKAQSHWLLTNCIRTGCKGAIWLSQRI